MIQKKVCLLGATGVGKTSLVRQFVEGIFSDKYLTTIGVKIDKKTVSLADETVQFMLWDIEGVDRYCGFQARYLRGAAAYIIVTDHTRSQSLIEGLEIHRMAKEVATVPSILAINKTDMDATWHWDQEELDGYKRDFTQTYQTSAKSGQNVEQMFTFLAEQLVEEK